MGGAGAQEQPGEVPALQLPIEKGTWRIKLVFFEEGRFIPAGSCTSIVAASTSRATTPCRR
jgi:hypothetical protein